MAVFALFPVSCPACHGSGREAIMGFLDHTLHLGDPIIRAVPAGGAGFPTGSALAPVGEALTSSFDDVVYLSCPNADCGGRFGPYTARELRHQLLRNWR